jgi:hypothetical protein
MVAFACHSSIDKPKPQINEITMGRNKRQKLANLPPTKIKKKKFEQRTQAATSKQNATFTIPFEEGDEILLVGEGSDCSAAKFPQ